MMNVNALGSATQGLIDRYRHCVERALAEKLGAGHGVSMIVDPSRLHATECLGVITYYVDGEPFLELQPMLFRQTDEPGSWSFTVIQEWRYL